MRILSITTKNFRLHADSHIELGLGVTGIVGDNEAGKSTLAVDAVLWALFGAKAIRGTLAGLRWYRAPARHTASVTLRFELAGHRYRLERGESTATLTDEGSGLVLAKGTEPVNGEVPKILGMGHEAFRSSFLCSQKDIGRISSLQPVERHAFIRKAMGHAKADEALKACRKRKSELSQERDGLAAGLGEREPLVGAVTEADANVIAAKILLDNESATAEGCAQVREKAQVDRDASMDDAREHHRLTGEHGVAATDIEKVAVESRRLSVKLADIVTAGERLAAQEPIVDTLPALRVDRDFLFAARAVKSERDTLLQRTEELHADITHREEVVEDAHKQVGFHSEDAWIAGSAAAQGAKEAFETMVHKRDANRAGFEVKVEAHDRDADLNSRRLGVLQETGSDGVCPTCARALGDAYEEVVAALGGLRDAAQQQAAICRVAAVGLKLPSDEEMEARATSDAAMDEADRLDTIREDAQRAKAVVARETPEIAKQKAALAEAQDRLAAMPVGAFDKEEFDSVEQEIVRIEAIDTALADDRAMVAQGSETRDLLAAQVILDADAQGRLDAASGALSTLAFDLATHDALERIVTEATEAWRNARDALATAIERGRGATALAERAVAALASYDTRAVRLTEIDVKHLAHEHTAARLADFRVAIATTLRPEMEELMSGFVQILTDGRHESVELSEDFDAILYENGVPVEVVSGGTEDIAALAMRLALSQMIAERAGHPLSLLILDEPFGSLDENRRGNVLTLIRRLKGVFSQVVVISHVAETRDAVDHVVELEFDEGAGRARVVSATYEEVA